MATKAQSKRGGPRKGAGRKKLPKSEQKTPVTTYIRNKTIKKNGGMESLKKAIISHFDSEK